MEEKQPLIAQKMITRFAIGLLLISGLLLGYRYVKERLYGDVGNADTAGSIAVVHETKDGAQVVLLKADGSILESPGYQEGKTDRDLAWRPDGNRLYFVSDREQDSYHLYRWNPASGACERRTLGSRSISNPSFAAEASDEANKSVILAAGGTIVEFDPLEVKASQLLPPINNEIEQGDEGGNVGQFDALYQKLGTSFKKAAWAKNKEYVVAIMKRERGEVLLMQKLNPTKIEEKAPIPIIAGDHIDFDINPKTGDVVYTVTKFQFLNPDEVPPEFIKNNKVVRPFEHILGAFDPSDPSKRMTLAISPTDQAAFYQPSIAPDGENVLVVIGSYTEGAPRSQALLLIPIQDRGLTGALTIAKGTISQPSWSPDDKTIAYIKRNGNERSVFTIGKDGSGEKNWTQGKGNFSMPLFSPQATP